MHIWPLLGTHTIETTTIITIIIQFFVQCWKIPKIASIMDFRIISFRATFLWIGIHKFIWVIFPSKKVHMFHDLCTCSTVFTLLQSSRLEFWWWLTLIPFCKKSMYAFMFLGGCLWWRMFLAWKRLVYVIRKVCMDTLQVEMSLFLCYATGITNNNTSTIIITIIVIGNGIHQDGMIMITTIVHSFYNKTNHHHQ